MCVFVCEWELQWGRRKGKEGLDALCRRCTSVAWAGLYGTRPCCNRSMLLSNTPLWLCCTVLSFQQD